MLRISPFLLAVLLPLAAAPGAQGSAIDDILPSDGLAGLEKVVSGGSSTCPESDKKADKKADPLELVVDDATPCPEDDKQKKAGGGDGAAKAGARDAAPADRKARRAQAATPPAQDDPSFSEEPADTDRAGDAAVTGVAAQNNDDSGLDDDTDLTLDEDNDVTLSQDDGNDDMLDDEDVGVDEDGDITVEEDDDESLPRTGLSVGVPALLGSLLLGGGVSLRRRMRRRDS